jgi:multicomponent Na+:H+ antiporter subunit B
LKALRFVPFVVFAALLMYGAAHLPARGDVDAPVHRQVSPANTPVAGTHYIQNAYRDARAPNMVTVVLADYRSTDTLGEAIVIFVGAMVVFFVLRRRPW